MRTHHRLPEPLRRWLAGVLAALIGFGPLLSPAYAAPTPLGDEPLNSRNSAKPNIVLTVDDSTSMLNDFLPDYVINSFCRGGTGAMTAACGNAGAASDFTPAGGGKYFSPGYTYQQYAYPYVQYGGGPFTPPYDPSGPGAGCYPGSPPTCSPGVNPGSLPGLGVYPAGPQPSWPNSGKPYEYWLYWPAPAHSASLNAIYYDPRLTYDPPVSADGTSYPQMDAGYTASWTQVPADPWATNKTYVDLVTPSGVGKTVGWVNLGLWCNSDWSVWTNSDPTKYPDPTQCRVNGSGAAAFGTVTAAQGKDYTYPWAPPGFTVSASPGATIANTYAAQKVTLTSASNPTDPNYIKYGPLFGEAVSAAWATAKDAKYFYENENVIWCDPTSPSWPQTGPVVGQTCGNYKSQLCSAQAQTCNKDPGTCSGNPSPAACNGWGTCQGYVAPACNGTPGTCNGFVAGSCNFGSCGNKKSEICNGTNQTCNGITGQTCSGPQAQSCNLPGTQTCQPPVCSITYSPAGCNLNPPDPENPCTPITTCAPPVCTPDPGTCSITKTSCTSDSQCTTQPGACSISGKACSSNTDCPSIGSCNIDKATCSSANDCAIINGTCSVKTSVACSKNTDCPLVGTCSNAGSAVCLFDTDCGLCNNPANTSCTSSAQCTPTLGSCNQKICSGGGNANKPCTQNANCPGGSCVTVSCSSNADCPVSGGTCTKPSNQACTLSSQCSATAGTCTNSNKTQCTGATQAAADAQCPSGTCNLIAKSCTTACTDTQFDANGNDLSCGCPAAFGVCKGSKITPAPVCYATACNQGQTQYCCSNIKTCSNTHSSCNSAVDCPYIPGQCSITNVPCTTPGFDFVNCPAVGQCSVTKRQCTSNANCPDQPGPLPPSAASCSTGGVGGNPNATLRNDAETAGVVCRRNNQTGASASYTSGPYDYPSGKYLTPISFGTGADACAVTNHYASVPRHYWKSEVQWCDKQVSIKGDQWLGFGTDVGGTCQAAKDATHIYPRFFQFGSASYVDNYATPAFQRVDLDVTKAGTASYVHTWVDAKGQVQTVTRSFADEMTNYANWFAYYRTRIQAVKTVTSLAFAALDNQYRVGFHTMSNMAMTPANQNDVAQFVNVADFDSTQKAAWYQQLFAITIPLQLDTPTLNAMERIGDYFLNGTSSDLPGSTDPITISCQKNWHMLFTDGFTNQAKPKALVGDQDNLVPPYPDEATKPIPGLTSGQPWPAPYRENSTQLLADAASDYAMKFWVTDLRTSGANADDNVPTSGKDPASWQHLNFAALSLGTQGKLPTENQTQTENALAAGTLQWPVITPNCGTCTVANQPDNSGVDDLWHAAINGRGRFVNAQTAAELKLGMGQILQDIADQKGTRAGAGLASSSISLSNNAVYVVTFQPGWAGTLTKIGIDPTCDPSNANCPETAVWQAATQLGGQLASSDPSCVAPITDPSGSGASSCPWFASRKVFTVADDKNGGPGSGVPFLWSNLSGAQQDSLAPGQAATGQAVLEFLRGNPSNEGTGVGQFRVRSLCVTGPIDPLTMPTGISCSPPPLAGGVEDFLGDIVDSQAVYVGPPNFPYLDGNEAAPYSTFASNNSARPARVYVGGNDGMLHAFDDATGNEAWAFIPHDLYRADATGLGALAYQDGALPPFRHHYYVDSTPRIYDAYFGGKWNTLLVGGLGKGGKSYYAIDVTDPASFDTETNAAGHYLWTFTDTDMGYTYGRAIITKTHAFNEKWLVIVPAGYNNGSGLGKIYFLDAANGSQVRTPIDTGVASCANGEPSGLAHIAGYTKDFHNQLTEQVYGGDLCGNLWRFDISDSDPGNWTVQRLAVLTDPSGTPQPVTTPPEIEVDVINGVDRWVFIGTGRLLASEDLTNAAIASQQQTFYAIRDGTTTTPSAIDDAKPLTRADLVPLTDRVNGLTSKPDKGWYDDLPDSGTGERQRIITPVKAALDLVAYAGTAPQDNPCLTGQEATLYVRSFSTGGSLLPGGVTDVNGGVYESGGAVGLDITIFGDSASGNTAGGLDIRIAVTGGNSTLMFQATVPPPELGAHRMSWRLLGQ